MLVLSRRPQEKITLPDLSVTIEVLGIRGGAVRLGIEAPAALRVLRAEVPDRVREWGAAPPAATVEAAPQSRLVQQRLRVTQKGLDQLQALLDAGRCDDARDILSRIAEDVQLLQRRLGDSDAAEPRNSAPQARRRKALLVEDNANERELLATFLRRAGVDVDTAGDGQDALDYLHGHGKPDVMLLDMTMPRCDGPTLLREVRRDPAYRGLKVFAVSGYQPEDFALDEAAMGVARWFSKPLDPSRLVRDLLQEV
jgi:carbon storage regulator CsrA